MGIECRRQCLSFWCGRTFRYILDETKPEPLYCEKHREKMKPNDKEQNEGLRQRSDDVDTDSKLVSFLYSLIRDHLPAGVVEGLVREAEPHKLVSLSNGWLGKYCEDLAKRLR